MCGIAGFVGGRPDRDVVIRMVRALEHRGPDDEGIWLDQEAGIALGHRRLSILDLSPAGHQPMHSASRRHVITMNGEIYNYEDLRSELADEGHDINWSGRSDTEVLAACFDAWGITRTLKRASGMFALAVWDRKERVLALARDRLGEKPLYYGRQHGPGSPFLFASELKALRQHPDFEAEIDREALGLFTRYLAVPAPLSIYRGISKLAPGTILRVGASGFEPVIELYWSGAQVALEGVAEPTDLDGDAATNALERVLDRAVGRQMMADVPVGAFLSGGIDSSTIVAVMQKLSPRPVKTFTIGFDEEAYNEARHAKAVARHLGTDHSELTLTSSEAMEVIPKLPAMYDEPFADSSQIPTHLISQLARKQVTVALSGDGGDELFGGYDRYRIAGGWWDRIASIPMPLRSAAARGLTMVPAAFWTSLGNAAGGLLPRGMRLKRLGDKVHKGATMLCSGSSDELYDAMLSLWRDPSELVIGASCSGAPLLDTSAELQGLEGIERMMAKDMLGYLPDDLLVKVDRAAMAVSLETRVPLLDPEVVEFAWRLPLDFKIRRGTSKWLLRQLLYRHVPPALIDRPKMGFGVPLDSWLRGPLRDWAEALLDERRLREEGYFRPQPIRKAWDEHLRGRNNQYKLWVILMFQSWLDAQKGAAVQDPPIKALAG